MPQNTLYLQQMMWNQLFLYKCIIGCKFHNVTMGSYMQAFRDYAKVATDIILYVHNLKLISPYNSQSKLIWRIRFSVLESSREHFIVVVHHICGYWAIHVHQIVVFKPDAISLTCATSITTAARPKSRPSTGWYIIEI